VQVRMSNLNFSFDYVYYRMEKKLKNELPNGLQ
jgi:hypothetical protein